MNIQQKKYLVTTFLVLFAVVTTGEEGFRVNKHSSNGVIEHTVFSNGFRNSLSTDIDNFFCCQDFQGYQVEQLDGGPDLHRDAYGAIVRFNVSDKNIYLVFTADVNFEGGAHILQVLEKKGIKGSFFFTGNFLRERSNYQLIRKIKKAGHYIGVHSDQHLLYCDWTNRDSLLITKDEFEADILNNFKELKRFGIVSGKSTYYIPSYEWYNKTIVEWALQLNMETINFTPGTGTNADYTTPDMPNYKSSVKIYSDLLKFERDSEHGLNGAVLLIHPGTSIERKDKFYRYLEDLVRHFSSKGYQFKSLK
ncbi:MAG TPA: polysaccharide deacetylase family protein [Mariniphaga sp.]|nr:polysaccharide deacetylase family protein [Mariniphaga sp.]